MPKAADPDEVSLPVSANTASLMNMQIRDVDDMLEDGTVSEVATTTAWSTRGTQDDESIDNRGDANDAGKAGIRFDEKVDVFEYKK